MPEILSIFSYYILAKIVLLQKISNVKNMNFDYYKSINISITICDTEGIVVYQNKKSLATFGDKVGQSMMPCHQQRSQDIIHHLLDDAATNVYTIDKKGVKKMIYQTPWFEDGVVKGLIEFSIVLPEEMPHYVR